MGGFALTNTFFYRFHQEFVFYVEKHAQLKNEFGPNFKSQFKFSNNNYPCNLMNWGGGLIFVRLLLNEKGKLEEFIANNNLFLND